MPQMNLSALSGQELRRLLDASRARGDAPLAYQILQEMAERREQREERGRSLLKRPAEPRVVALNLGDPLETEDDLPPMPNWRAPELVAEAEPAPQAEPEPTRAPPRSRRSKTPPQVVAAPVAEDAPPEAPTPRGVWDDDPAPVAEEPVQAEGLDLRLDRPERAAPREPRRFRRPPGLGFAAGIALGAAAGWWGAGYLQAPPTAPAPVVAPVQTAALEPQATPATLPITVADAAPEPAPEAPPEPTGGPLPPDLPEGPLVSPDAADDVVEPSPAPAAVVRASSSGAGACTSEPTPADREICRDPSLQQLQRELRQAYAEALEAHEDRDLLRQRQLAWRDARNTVSEPDRLARLYEQRIQKLNAATAEARRQR
jgi:uncharacterized protein YecT (DUF1311 family)